MNINFHLKLCFKRVRHSLEIKSNFSNLWGFRNGRKARAAKQVIRPGSLFDEADSQRVENKVHKRTGGVGEGLD